LDEKRILLEARMEIQKQIHHSTASYEETTATLKALLNKSVPQAQLSIQIENLEEKQKEFQATGKIPKF
jgi:hypothetical protein